MEHNTTKNNKLILLAAKSSTSFPFVGEFQCATLLCS